MPKKIENSAADSHFAFYHQSESLLFQFLMHESLRTLKILRKRPNTELLVQVIGNLEADWDKWPAPMGHLPRLKHYTTLLSRHFGQPNPSHCEKLHAILGRAYLAAKKFQSLSQRKKHCTVVHTELKKELSLFFRLLLQRLPDFQDDATILYFLLRNQQQVDSFYRQPFTKKTFDLFFPNGSAQARAYFVEKFAKKGCTHLIPTVEKILKQLGTHSNDEE